MSCEHKSVRERERAFTQNLKQTVLRSARPDKVRRKEIWKTSSKLVESERTSESMPWGSECDDDIPSSNGTHQTHQHTFRIATVSCVLTCLLREWTSSSSRPRPLPRQNSEHSPNECVANERRCDKSNCVRLHLIVIFKWNAFQTSCPCTREEFSSLIFFLFSSVCLLLLSFLHGTQFKPLFSFSLYFCIHLATHYVQTRSDKSCATSTAHFIEHQTNTTIRHMNVIKTKTEPKKKRDEVIQLHRHCCFWYDHSYEVLFDDFDLLLVVSPIFSSNNFSKWQNFVIRYDCVETREWFFVMLFPQKRRNIRFKCNRYRSPPRAQDSRK